MRVLTLFLVLFSGKLIAQPCSGPGRTPQTATVVCGTLTFFQQNLPNCNGQTVVNSLCSGLVSDHASWYRFRCYQTGTLGFTITPLGPNDDYDWAVMDITGRAPQDVYTTNLAISVNLCGFTGATGCSSLGSTDGNCAGNTFLWNRMPNLIAGNDYLLLVSNWSQSGMGYNLTFSGGTAVLTDNLLPTITNVGTVGCNSSQIQVQLSEDILCNSFSAANTEFTITDGTNTYPFTSISSACSNGLNAVTGFSINMQNPLPAGNYNLVVNTGADGNSLLDVCNTELIPGSSFPFTIAAQPAPVVDTLLYNGCAPTVLKLALNKIVTCGSITNTGSEFSITPGTHTITSVQTVCSGSPAATDTIIINLQNPLPHGNYQLNINNGSDGNTIVDTCGTSMAAGYMYPFTIIQTTTAPAVQSVSFDECKPFKVLVNFDKPVACSSISADGSEFSISPGALTVTGIVSNCVNGFSTQVELSLSGSLPAGNFNMNINSGTDGNTLADSCFAFISAPAVTPFVTTQAPVPIFDSVQYDRCSPNSIKVFYSKPLLCSSINANGSEFSITGPAPVAITSASTDVTCSSGYTNWVTLSLSQPINTFGTFVLHNTAGADGNSVMDTCYAPQDVNEIISFNVLGRPSATFEDSLHLGCVNDTIVVSHPGGNGINSWQWTFSDGTVVNGPAASQIFPASTPTASVQLIVSNGTCSDTLTRTYTLNNAFNVAFSASADTVCRNTDVSFSNSSSGNNLSYQWNFGDNSTFNGQQPPPHAYANPGTYNVVLTATNNIGCINDSMKIITVVDTVTVRFTGLNSQYCTGDQVNLSTNIVGANVVSYNWNNGNGIITTNQPTINYPYNNEGAYTVTLTATDRYCGSSDYSETTQVYKLPVFSLGNDLKLCPGMQTTIGVAPVTGYTYSWSNGATTSQILSAPVTTSYTLTCDNNGCVATDDITVTVMDHCLIKVPGAFTPNNDGLNDILKAINADLAGDFLFQVYNRFGQLVFSTRVPTSGWDGTFKGIAASAGTYVWQLSYTHPTSGQKVYEKGTSILIR